MFLIFSDIKDNKNLVEQTVLVLRRQSLQFILFSQLMLLNCQTQLVSLAIA